MCRCCYIKGATVDFMEDISVVTGEKENKKVHETAKWQSCVVQISWTEGGIRSVFLRNAVDFFAVMRNIMTEMDL